MQNVKTYNDIIILVLLIHLELYMAGTVIWLQEIGCSVVLLVNFMGHWRCINMYQQRTENIIQSYNLFVLILVYVPILNHVWGTNL